MKKWLLLLGLALAVFAAAIPAQEKKPDDQPWQWGLDKVKAAVSKVRAGKNLTPPSWPDAAKVAVGLSFDFDAETNSLRDANLSPGSLSQGEYGAREGIPRILALLDKYRIPATFFVPAVTAILHPAEVKMILDKKRHEIGLHGWIHERNSLLAETDERDLMKKSFDALGQAMGRAPVGIRTPSWDFSPSTLKLIRELGLIYDSSLMADDSPYEILEDGKATGVVELPVEWILDDYPYFGFDRFTSVRPQATPDEVLSIWAAEFDKAYAEGGLFILTLHPKYIGHRSRIVMLERLIQHILERKDVWFATHEDIARAAQKGIKK